MYYQRREIRNLKVAKVEVWIELGQRKGYHVGLIWFVDSDVGTLGCDEVHGLYENMYVEVENYGIPHCHENIERLGILACFWLVMVMVLIICDMAERRMYLFTQKCSDRLSLDKAILNWRSMSVICSHL